MTQFRQIKYWADANHYAENTLEILNTEMDSQSKLQIEYEAMINVKLTDPATKEVFIGT